MKINERAAQLWPVLVLSAQNQQILSYMKVEKLIGIPRSGVGKVLGPIQRYCKKQKYPPLTILIVKEETGFPGKGFTGTAEGAKARVFVFDWFKNPAPSPADFE